MTSIAKSYNGIRDYICVNGVLVNLPLKSHNPDKHNSANYDKQVTVVAAIMPVGDSGISSD